MLSPRTRVAVIRGGPSSEYEVSLKSGAHVLSLLRESPETYEPVDIFISKDGEWHRDGLVHEPHRALKHIDVVFNAMHGAYGEDGQLQQLLEAMHIPFTGSGVLGSALAMNKELAKNIYNQHSLLTPRHEVITDEADDKQLLYIFQNYLHPVIVKPASGGSSIGIRLARTFQELEEAVKHAFGYSKKVLVEEFIRGKEGTCGVVENARGQQLYALLPVEIRSHGKDFFDFDSKYSGETEEICPGNFKPAEREMMAEMARKAHQALGLRHYSRSDFLITPKGRVYIIETNSLPRLTEESLLPKSLKAVGWQPREFVSHCLNLALNRVW